MPRTRPLLPLLLLFPACADGGQQSSPQSEVQIAANHHLMWFRSLPGFGTVATRPEAVNAGHALLAMANDSTYTLQLPPPGGSTGAERYALETDGRLSVFNTGSGREPSTVFLGAYRLVGSDPDLFFTDRVSAGSSPSVGLYFGTQVKIGQVELEGAWHVFSLHVMLQPSAVASARNVARSMHGAVSASAGAAGELRTISGTGTESANDASSTASVTLGGSIQNLLDGSLSGDGSCNLTVDYTNSGSPTNSRVFRAAAGNDVVLAVDEDESDAAAGLLFLVRKFDAPAETADPARIAGDYLIGGHTVFVNPTNAGSNAFVGTLALTAQGGFRLDAVGHQGLDFAYTGTWTNAADGAITLSISGTNETWHAAVNRSYDTLVLVDTVVENRANNNPELNLLLGVRKHPD